MAELASTPKGKGIEWAARSELTHIIHSFIQSINGLTPSEAGSNCPDKVPDTAALRDLPKEIPASDGEVELSCLASTNCYAVLLTLRWRQKDGSCSSRLMGEG
ncbi:uncharacterized protein RSE6_13892 [Rhynchosporium secalis]|uniref:Uncharacterized protein n=1 Tax=Rhynchosporium secalis TaxID=38038 RepID=A0A1E1MUP1_RHYSE|nr:uncharacterized protein RSE6_13892 [Rhynchosporium secalis]